MINRIYHTWDKWECYPAGLHNQKPPKDLEMDDEACKEAYREFLSDLPRFAAALDRVLREWPMTCEHNLTNESMNRLAWLGQAAMCIETGIPAIYRGGFNRLTPQQQEDANLMALKYLNIFTGENLTLDTAKSKTEANQY